ncbi:hypothetical protein [Dyella agri]|uniref:Uncharacterized protein n=1 Tax=Dyella agri TaxID=1926869 RepID=A0ABW8KKM6_9GAMM
MKSMILYDGGVCAVISGSDLQSRAATNDPSRPCEKTISLTVEALASWSLSQAAGSFVDEGGTWRHQTPPAAKA